MNRNRKSWVVQLSAPQLCLRNTRSDMSEKVLEIARRDEFRFHLSIPTRWGDNDTYGHVNNVIYYSYFDTLVNAFLIQEGKLDIAKGPTIGIVAESLCRFHRSLVFPEVIDACLRVKKLGNSSVCYEIALFRQTEAAAAATGHFVHVFVDRQTMKPAPIPSGIRAALERLAI